MTPLTLRTGRPDDATAIARLAALDSRPLPRRRLVSAKTKPWPGSTTPQPKAPFLLAEEDGTLCAALSLTTGAAIADPFTPSAHLVALRRHATHRTAPPTWSGFSTERVRSRLPRLALQAG
jgi:hypothetical protein